MEVGQKVYVKDYYGGRELREYEIVKVGRTYFYISMSPNSRQYKVKINNLACLDATSFKIYLSAQNYYDEQEYSSTAINIEKIISSPHYNKITLQQLRQIKAIIEEQPKDEVTYPTDETISVDTCICPYCGHEFNGRRAINDDLDKRIIECPKCKKEMEVYPSVEYMCSSISEEEAT